MRFNPVTALGAGVIAASLAVGPAIAAQGPEPVLVMNGPSSAVPVAGTVALAVDSTVGLAPGTAVGIDPAANGVRVTNDELRVAPANDPQPVQIPIVVPLLDSTITTNQVIYTVPDGKRFIADYVSMSTPLEDGLHPLVQIDFRSPQHGRVFVPFEGYELPSLTDWVASEQLTAIAEQGSEIKLFFTRRQGGRTNTSLAGVLTGHLVDAEG